MSFRPAGLDSLEQTGALCSRYPTFLQASADIRLPSVPASAGNL
ncbi:hypothetical protein [Methanosarcina horonobensis]|nr:hypothetical protein [Methanosarcina horonobensis]